MWGWEKAHSGENRSFATKGNIFHLPNHQCSGAFAVTFREIPLGDVAICRIYSGLLVYSLKLILGGCMLKKVGWSAGLTKERPTRPVSTKNCIFHHGWEIYHVTSNQPIVSWWWILIFKRYPSMNHLAIGYLGWACEKATRVTTASGGV